MSGARVGRGLIAVATVAVIAGLGAGLWTLGPPVAQRALRMDERRVTDLDNITRHIDRWWQEHEALPADLATLAARPGVRLAIVDPEDGTAYEFAATGADRYRLCARFVTDSGLREGRRHGSERWPHAVGRHCFERVVATDTD